jgi:hypothetical protein
MESNAQVRSKADHHNGLPTHYPTVPQPRKHFEHSRLLPRLLAVTLLALLYSYTCLPLLRLLRGCLDSTPCVDSQHEPVPPKKTLHCCCCWLQPAVIAWSGLLGAVAAYLC